MGEREVRAERIKRGERWFYDCLELTRSFCLDCWEGSKQHLFSAHLRNFFHNYDEAVLAIDLDPALLIPTPPVALAAL